MIKRLFLLTVCIAFCSCNFDFASGDLFYYVSTDELDEMLSECRISAGATSADCREKILEVFPVHSEELAKKEVLAETFRHLFFMPLLFNDQRPLLKAFKGELPGNLDGAVESASSVGSLSELDDYYNERIMLFMLQRFVKIQFRDRHPKVSTALARYESKDGTLTLYGNFFSAPLATRMGTLIHEGLHYDFGDHGTCGGKACDEGLTSPYGAHALGVLLSMESIQTFSLGYLSSGDRSAINAYFSACEALSKIKNLPSTFPQSLNECVGGASAYFSSF